MAHLVGKLVNGGRKHPNDGDNHSPPASQPANRRRRSAEAAKPFRRRGVVNRSNR